MQPSVDTSSFPVGRELDYESEEEVARLKELASEARSFVQGFHWAPPIEDLVLAFGVGPILGLFLARFEHSIASGGCKGDIEIWVVVGDLPPAYFVVDDAPTPAEALEIYCELMEDWADRVLADEDLSDSYPIAAEPTMEHGKMLKSRIGFIRSELIPDAE